MGSHFVSRRRALKLFGSVTGVTLLTACGGQASTPPASAVTTASVASSPLKTQTSGGPTQAKTQTSGGPTQAKTQTSAGPAPAAATAATGSATIRWIFGDMDKGRAALLDKVATQFEQAHPGVKVQADFVSDKYEDLISTWAASGTLYDVFFNLTNEVAPRAVKGMSVPLDPFIARDHLSLAQFNNVEMTNCTWQGKIHALPFDWSINAVYVNKDLFQAAGVTLPPADGAWTYDDLFALAKPFSKTENGKPVQWGFDGLPNYQASFGVLQANGGNIVSDDLRQCVLNNPQNVATLEFFRDLMRKWHVTPGPGELPKGVGNAFVGGLAAMARQGTWVVEDMRTKVGKHFVWDVVPMPKGSTGKIGATGFGATWSVGVSTKQKDRAWSLLTFVSSSQAEALSLGSGSLPGNIDAYPAYLNAMQQGGQPPEHISSFVDVVKAGVFTIPNMPYYDEAAPIVYKAIADVYAGKETSATLGQAQQQINAIIPKYTF